MTVFRGSGSLLDSFKNSELVVLERAMGGIIERQKELRQRRHRKKKLKVFKRRLAKATASEKAHIAAKIRRLTPGGSVIVANLGLEERK